MRKANLVILALVSGVVACGDSKPDPLFSGSSKGGTGGTTGAGANGTGATGNHGGTTGFGGSHGGTNVGGGLNLGGGAGSGVTSMGGSVACMPTNLDADQDGDGWTPNQGDCDDCSPSVNPGAVDVLKTDMNGNPLPDDQQVDADCDNVKPSAANWPPSCDGSISVGAPGSGFDAARAIGLCNVMVPDNPPAGSPKTKDLKWGVIDAKFGAIDAGALAGNSTPALSTDFGILDNFGAPIKPQEGARLLALSNGEARAPGNPGFMAQNPNLSLAAQGCLGENPGQCCWDKGYQSNFPGVGSWPKNGSCGTTGDPHDGVALDLKIRAPTNATALSFNFRFFTCEFPVYTCMTYNDVFAVLLVSGNGAMSGLPTSDPMYPDVAFEATMAGAKNVIGVNNQSFLTACQPGAVPNYGNCKGEQELQGTGFEGHAASAWLRSQVPVVGGDTIYLRIAIWDSADGILDSTAVLDNFQWSADAEAGMMGTSTTVVPNPKLGKFTGRREGAKVG